MTAVVFALVLFFAGVAGRVRSTRSAYLLGTFAAVVLLFALILLATQPVTI